MHGRGDAVGRVDDRRAGGHLGLLVHEDRAPRLEIADDVDVVDDLLAHVDRARRSARAPSRRSRRRARHRRSSRAAMPGGRVRPCRQGIAVERAWSPAVSARSRRAGSRRARRRRRAICTATSASPSQTQAITAAATGSNVATIPTVVAGRCFSAAIESEKGTIVPSTIPHSASAPTGHGEEAVRQHRRRSAAPRSGSSTRAAGPPTRARRSRDRSRRPRSGRGGRPGARPSGSRRRARPRRAARRATPRPSRVSPCQTCATRVRPPITSPSAGQTRRRTGSCQANRDPQRDQHRGA